MRPSSHSTENPTSPTDNTNCKYNVSSIKGEDELDCYEDWQLYNCTVVPKSIFIAYDSFAGLADSVLHQKKREYSKKL